MTNETRTGLNDAEVILNRRLYGTNSINAGKNYRFFKVLFEIIKEPLFILLVFTATLYFVLGELTEGIIMIVALNFVAGISLYQENKSRNAVDALKKLSSPRARVIRNGQTIEIISDDLVVNDLIVLEDGNIVPADATINEAHDFSVNESILTGESLPVFRDSSSGNNKLYMSTLIMSGSCLATVTGVGNLTKVSLIGQSLKEIEVSATPLQRQIKSFVRSMVGAGVIAFIIVWGINYYLTDNILEGLLHGLTLAMSVLPEEIPVAFSTFMALGAYHLYKNKVIARSPHTVETLGAATVICVDKTGTITENDMRLVGIYDFKRNITEDYTALPFSFNEVLEYAMWASESEPFDHMEKSIHEVYGLVTSKDKRPVYTLTHEYPLSGKPPIMTHVFSDSQSSHIIAVKGSLEGVLNQCRLTHDQTELIQKMNFNFSSRGFRVLAIGKSSHDIMNLPASQHEFEFEFIGLVAFFDPPKKNMTRILQQFYTAGIRMKMITGDYSETALAIARQIKFRNNSVVLTGDDILAMEKKELCLRVQTVDIFARMYPEAKLKVIEALKSNGEVVAMTGDGVNDGPALKAAHIGIAMGTRGSELAKKVASLILVDDDLSHMVDAVALGRRIYENLKKAIQYIISIHIPIILIVTVPLVLFWKFTHFFSPIHVIFLELIMGPTCSIIFENEPIESDSMQKQPRKMSTAFFSLKELALSIIQGLAITITCLGLGYYFMINHHSETLVRTIIYSTLIFSNLFLTLANRSFRYSVITTIRYKNNLLPAVLIISIIVLLLSVYFNPVRIVFEFTALSLNQLLISFSFAFCGVMWIELYKLAKRKLNKEIKDNF